MTEIRCDLCGDPTDGYCCRRCAIDTATQLKHAVELADEVETTVARLARYAHRGAHRAAAVTDDERPTAKVNRRQPVGVFGWPASRVRRERAALRPQPLPVDLAASAQAAQAFTHLAAWARTVLADRGGALPVTPGRHPAGGAARFLLFQLDWIRHQHFAAQCFTELRTAGTAIKRVVDSPPERELVGRCDCRDYLYAYTGSSTVTCVGCGLRWDVETSREGLRQAILGRLVTAAEAGTLLVIFGVEGTRRRFAKTITMWSQRRLVTTYPPIEAGGPPLFLFADVFDRFTLRRAA